MLEIVVIEPDLISFDLWLASNPNEESVRRWLMAIGGVLCSQGTAGRGGAIEPHTI